MNNIESARQIQFHMSNNSLNEGGFVRHQITMDNGAFTFSIQAGEGKYSEPEDSLPLLRDYASVELAIIQDFEDGSHRLISPSNVDQSLAHWDRFWEGDSVASWVPYEDLMSMLDEFVSNGHTLRSNIPMETVNAPALTGDNW